MRNVIVFINICIVAGVTMLLVDFESNGSKHRARASSPAVASLSETSTAKEPAGSSLISLKQKDLTSNRRPLSKKEAQFVKDFINGMSQVRIMGREQSKLAAQRGTTRPLKDYGAWLVINQQQMLDDLNKIAAEHGMEVATVLNSSLTASLSELEQLHGRRFDVRYIKSLTAELKRDLKRLEEAAYSRDAAVQVFAARYTAITKDNLEKLQRLRKKGW